MPFTIRVAGGLSPECDLRARNFLGVRIPELSSQCSGSFAMSLRTIGVACFLLKRENYTAGTAPRAAKALGTHVSKRRRR